MNQFTVLLSIAYINLIQGTPINPLQPWRNFQPSSNQRIVGGFQIDIADAPFQVSLQSFGHFCGGSIIGERWVLTAAHCVNGQDVLQLEVRAGSSHHASGGQLVQVARIILHPKSSGSTFDYDIALLELAQPLQLTAELYAVKLPEQDEPVADGQLLQVSGWGLTHNDQESSEVLRATNVPTVNQEECRQAYSSVNEISARMLCAGYKAGGKDHCHGDSGGPLVQGNTLVGVVSWGQGCAQPGYPGVYGRVAAMRDWIREVSGI